MKKGSVERGWLKVVVPPPPRVENLEAGGSLHRLHDKLSCAIMLQAVSMFTFYLLRMPVVLGQFRKFTTLTLVLTRNFLIDYCILGQAFWLCAAPRTSLAC